MLLMLAADVVLEHLLQSFALGLAERDGVRIMLDKRLAGSFRLLNSWA